MVERGSIPASNPDGLQSQRVVERTDDAPEARDSEQCAGSR